MQAWRAVEEAYWSRDQTWVLFRAFISDAFCLTFRGLQQKGWPVFLLCNTLIVLSVCFHAFLSLSFVPHSKLEPLAERFHTYSRSHTPGFEAAIGLYSDCMTWHRKAH